MSSTEPGFHTALINGLTRAYHVHGDGPILVVHPGGPGVDWSYVRMRSLERDVAVVYLEPIGSGASSRLRVLGAGCAVSWTPGPARPALAARCPSS